MELNYKQFFEATPCYLTVQDRDLRIIASNERFKQHFGDNVGRFCFHAYKRRSEPCENCPVERTFRDGESHTSEELLINADGREVAVIVHTTPIFDAQGEVEAVMEMSTDITGIKQLQEQLRASKERYQLIFDEVPCFISIQDRELGIVDANRRFKESFGRALGRKCYKVYKHRDEQCYPCAVQRTFDDGEVHRSEEVVSSLEGQSINTLVYTAPIRSPGGEIRSVMEMSTDITPIRELQSQLESIGLLISSISHGIKGLLTGLDGGVYMVNSGLKKDKRERVEQGWEMVQRNIRRIRDMVLNILYYAKEREPEWAEVAAPGLAEEVLAIVAPRAAELEIELEPQIDQEAGVFDVDLKAVRSLLVNLLENSLDACRMDRKKTDHRVGLRLIGGEDAVTFEVSDNGIGMDRETRESAFNLFFSAKGGEGTGLGLFISNKIAVAHGGSIEVESELGKGTSFVVRIPRTRTPG
jgi:PAS domain S-box-containing protein